MLSFERMTRFYQICTHSENQDGQKSPEDQQESGRLTRTRSYKRHEDPRTPAKVRKSARVKEDCQVSRIQKLKSLEDWHNLRVKTQEDDSTISPPARGGEIERERKDRLSRAWWNSVKTPLNQPLTHIRFPLKGNKPVAKKEEESLNRGVYKVRTSPWILSSSSVPGSPEHLQEEPPVELGSVSELLLPSEYSDICKKFNLTGKKTSLIKNLDQDLINHLAIKA